MVELTWLELDRIKNVSTLFGVVVGFTLGFAVAAFVLGAIG